MRGEALIERFSIATEDGERVLERGVVSYKAVMSLEISRETIKLDDIVQTCCTDEDVQLVVRPINKLDACLSNTLYDRWYEFDLIGSRVSFT